ncbi:MAG: hypothetical protein ACJ75S_11225 [Solirubrobacterales bacterium]
MRWSNRRQREGREDFRAADDPDLVDQRLQQCLARRRVTALDYLPHLGLQQRQILIGERLALGGLFGGQLLSPGLQPAQLLA